METTSGTEVEIRTCKCSSVPGPHWHMDLDRSERYHPIFSKRGANALLEADRLYVNEGDTPEIRRFIQSSDLPDTHLFDVSAEFLDVGDVPGSSEYEVDDAQQQDERHAGFEICAFCGAHGVLFDRNENVLARPRTKEQALQDLEQFVALDKIEIEDRKAVREAILDSALPDREEKANETGELVRAIVEILTSDDRR